MSRTRTYQHLIAAGALAVGLAGCYHSTQLANTWRDPTTGPLHFQKVVVAFATTDESLRRTVEDRLAQKIPNSVQSYRVAADARTPDSSAIRQRFADLGFDGAVIMRVADVDTRINYPYGTYWYGRPYGFGSYWGSSWGYAYDPYVTADRIVAIETQIYALGNDRLVWAARSETTNPRSVTKLTDSVIKHVMNALQKDGLIVSIPCIACADARPGN
jgi:hypothetical protein